MVFKTESRVTFKWRTLMGCKLSFGITTTSAYDTHESDRVCLIRMIGVQSNDACLIMHDWRRRCRSVACGATRAVCAIHEKRYRQRLPVLACSRKRERGIIFLSNERNRFSWASSHEVTVAKILIYRASMLLAFPEYVSHLRCVCTLFAPPPISRVVSFERDWVSFELCSNRMRSWLCWLEEAPNCTMW